MRRRRMLLGSSPVASVGICCHTPPLPHTHTSAHIHKPHPHFPHPLCPPPSRSLAWQTGSVPGSASKWQPCGGPPCGTGQGLISGELILTHPPLGWGDTPDRNTHWGACRDSTGGTGHWSGGCSVRSLDALSPVSTNSLQKLVPDSNFSLNSVSDTRVRITSVNFTLLFNLIPLQILKTESNTACLDFWISETWIK